MTTASRPPRTCLQDGVLVIENDNAPYNRMDFAFMDALEGILAEAAENPAIRVLVFTAAGDAHFSVGMDLKQLHAQLQALAPLPRLAAVLDQRLRVLAMIESMEKPSIATLFGYCLGGGLELPLACHFRLAAAEGAQIGLPELELGTMPAWGGTARLARCIGRDRALDMILRARKIDGAEALTIGLVHAVHPLTALKPAALALARDLAAQPAMAVAGVLRAVVGAGDGGLAEAWAEERRGVLRCAVSADHVEGMRAFLEKRRPRFNA